ncbi:MAG: hypothetical protein OER96_10765 [Gammaproteobacteria bacterium]|nr:hypothetical protein [Gammaproteobacteria bacterium]
MDANMNQITSSSHDEIFLLLPWYVNSTLDADEHTIVSSHIAECAICRQEVEYLTRVDSVVKEQDDVHAIAQNGFARMMHRIDQDDADTAQIQSSDATISEKLSSWWKSDWFGIRGLGIAIPAMLVIAVAGKFLWPTPLPDDPAYQTLSSENPTSNESMQFKVTLVENAESVLLQNYFREIWGTTAIIKKTPDGGYSFELPPDASPVEITQLLNQLKSSENIKSVELGVD